jgi:hypothetical protein
MKKIIFGAMTVCMLLSAIPVQLNATTTSAVPSTPAKTIPSAETTVMMERLYEIKAMDIASMSSAEKKQLRKEVRTIKSDMRAATDGVYLSVGAIIIIVLLLILIL